MSRYAYGYRYERNGYVRYIESNVNTIAFIILLVSLSFEYFILYICRAKRMN